jgi:hypothetical protein
MSLPKLRALFLPTSELNVESCLDSAQYFLTVPRPDNKRGIFECSVRTLLSRFLRGFCKELSLIRMTVACPCH